MIQLSNETIDRILHRETAKKEDLSTILRALYARYMRLYERYFADLDALDDDVIAEMRKYHEETLSLAKVYYMDIPQDICTKLEEFEEKYGARLLGPSWRRVLWDSYEEYRKKSGAKQLNGKTLKAEFAQQGLKAFYESMGYIFREGFGTESQAAKHVLNGISELFFGKEK